MSTIDAAAAAAAREAAIRAAQERARKAAEEAARKAAEAAAKKAAAAAAKKAAEAAAAKAAVQVRAKKGFGKDELSTGLGSALKARSLSATGANLKPLQIASDAKTFKATDLQQNPNKQIEAKKKSAVEQLGEKAHTALTKLGLKDEDLLEAGKQALPELKKAGEAAADGKWDEAVKSLEAAGRKGAVDLAKSAIEGLAKEHLTGPAKEILSDPKVVDQLFKSAPGAIDKIIDGKIGPALKGLAADKPLRDAVLTAAMKDEGFAGNIKQLGLTTADLKSVGDALPSIIEAAEKLAKDDGLGAIDALADAAKQAPEVVAKAIEAAAVRLPDGLAKTILSDPKAALAIAKAGPDAIKTALKDGPRALEQLLGNKDLRDPVISAAMKDDAFKAQVTKLGLTEADLKQAGDALPSLIDAAQAFSKEPPDTRAALNALADAATKAPELVAKAVVKAASGLEDGVAKAILTDPKVAAQLAKGSPDALRALANGDVAKALGSVATNKPLREAVIDAAFTDTKFASDMKELGLNAVELKEGADALPDVFKAVQAVAKNDIPGALAALRNAAEKAPVLTAKITRGIADQLPAGPVKDLLSDAKLARQLITDPQFHGAVKQMLDGDVVGGLSNILRNETVRDGVLDVVAKNADVKQALQKVGLTNADLKQAGAAAPHVLDAMKQLADGQPQQALESLGKAGAAAPALLSKIGGAIFDKLPPALKEGLTKLGVTAADIKEAPLALPDLVTAGKKAVKGDWKGAIDAVLDAGEKAPTLATKLIQNAGKALPDGLAKNLLTDPAVAASLAGDATLHDGINQLLDGKLLDGASTLLHNDAARDAVLKVVANDPAVKKALEAVKLTPADLIEAGAASPHLLDAARHLTAKPIKWQEALDSMGQAASAAPELLNKVGEAIYAQLPPSVQRRLEGLGLTPTMFKEAGQALPHLVNAAKAFAEGKPQDALKELGQVIGAAPELVTRAITTIAGKLPEGLARTLLTDPATVKNFLTDPDVKDVASKLLNGDVTGALRELGEGLRTGSDSPLIHDIAAAIIKDPKLSAKLKEFGIESADDIVSMGAVIGDTFELIDDLANQRWGEAIKGLGAIAADLPDGLRTKIIDTLGDKMGLSPELRTVLSGVVDAMGDPEVRDAIGDAFAAFKSGNPADWIKGLANAGRVIADQSPDLAISFLDTLSHLPGSVGAFFSDHELNESLVKSGSVEHIFTAVEKLAEGDVVGAVKELGNAFGSLLTMGDHFEVGPYGALGFNWGPKELPIGKEGLEAVGRLMKQFVEALPAPVKEFLEKKIASVVAKAGFRSIPVVGPAIGLVEDGVELFNDFKNGEDGLTTAIDAASLVVNGASIFPPFQAAAQPLKVIIGIGEGLNETVQFVQEIQDFGEQFTGMAA
ncbi:MAG: hypothetical protein Q8K32_14665 [Archangium sp.]|nr:hypothetical protein [Archangium sp.]